MNKVAVISMEDTTLELSAALLLYKSRRGDVYVTSHKVEVDPKQSSRAVLGPGVAASKESLATFATAVTRATAYAGFVSEQLLYTSANLIAWWTPAAVRTTWFSGRDDERGLGNSHGPAAHPALVFVVIPGDWFVFALPESKRPTPDTKLCHAPHFNVWDGGRICTGNVTLPSTIDSEAIAVYEEAFFRSHFTHPNRDKVVKYAGGMPALWRDQLANPDPAAMSAALIKTKHTLSATVERIAGLVRN